MKRVRLEAPTTERCDEFIDAARRRGYDMGDAPYPVVEGA